MALSGPDEPPPTDGVQTDSRAAESGSGSTQAAVSAHGHDGQLARERDLLTHLFLSLGKLLGVVVTLVTLVGAVVTLIFQVDPTLVPCIGGGQATFTGVVVVPDYTLQQYISDVNNGNVPDNVPPTVGAEVRYSYSASNLSGNHLRLYTTLEQVAPNGDMMAPPSPPGGVLSSANLQSQVGLPGQPVPVVTPDRCSLDSSGLDWVYLPSARPRHRYRILLEFYRGGRQDFTDRVGVGMTPVFDY
jgi:hypothetical protein